MFLLRYLVLTIISHSKYCTEKPRVTIYYINAMYLHFRMQVQKFRVSKLLRMVSLEQRC